ALTAGGASGVSINIKKADGTNIDINSTDSGIALTSATTQQLRFTANYISTAASVTAGAANAVAQVNISYM
ncbi:TPA: fimbrial protein, partial [Klebsiella pneumoniae]